MRRSSRVCDWMRWNLAFRPRPSTVTEYTCSGCEMGVEKAERREAMDPPVTTADHQRQGQRGKAGARRYAQPAHALAIEALPPCLGKCPPAMARQNHPVFAVELPGFGEKVRPMPDGGAALAAPLAAPVAWHQPARQPDQSLGAPQSTTQCIRQPHTTHAIRSGLPLLRTCQIRHRIGRASFVEGAFICSTAGTEHCHVQKLTIRRSGTR